MPVDVSDILHVLAHELRTPVGIAHGYVRLLLEDRLPEPERRRALEQMQKALGRLSDLSRESTALASWLEQEQRADQTIDARELIARVGDATYDWPVTVDTDSLPEGASVPTADGAALARALIDVVRATARELRGVTCDVRARVAGGQFEMLAGPDDLLDAVAAGPEADGAGPVALERGGLGLALVHAAVVLDAHRAQRWTINGSRQTIGVRLPLQERPLK